MEEGKEERGREREEGMEGGRKNKMAVAVIRPLPSLHISKSVRDS